MFAASGQLFNKPIDINCQWLDRLTFEHGTKLCLALSRNFSMSDFIVFGDFNVSSVKWTMDDDSLAPTDLHSSSAETLIDTMYFLELRQIKSVRKSNGGLLDLIFVDELDCISVSSCLDPLIAIDKYHPAIETRLSLRHDKAIRSQSLVTVSQFQQANYTALNDFLWGPAGT